MDKDRCQPVQTRVHLPHSQVFGIWFHYHGAAILPTREEPEAVKCPVSTQFNHRSLGRESGHYLVEDSLFLRFVAAARVRYQLRHPLAAVAICKDAYAVVHDLHAGLILENLHLARSRSPRNMVHVATPSRELDALVGSERIRHQFFKLAWIRAGRKRPGTAVLPPAFFHQTGTARSINGKNFCQPGQNVSQYVYQSDKALRQDFR